MNLQSWLLEHDIENPLTTVKEIPSGTPIKQYQIKVTGTEAGAPVVFAYVNIKEKASADAIDVEQRRDTYEHLHKESVTEKIIADEALRQILVIEPDPEVPDPPEVPGPEVP